MTEVKLFRHLTVMLYLCAMAHLCYTRSPSFIQKVEVMEHLNRLNKRPVKSIKSPDGDIIDCVHISHQIAFDHPLLKNHTIKTKPSYHPNCVKDDHFKTNASKVGPLTTTSEERVIQLWHSNGKCPEGTIPVIRTKKENSYRANSIKSYGKKMRSFPVAHQSSTNPEATDGQRHEYAYASTTQGIFYGSQATFNLWNPKVQEHGEFSLGQLWILAGSESNLNTIEAGWHVNPMLHGDTNTRLFIFWTSDGYHTKKCYNLLCPGFVQTNNEIAIGGSLSTSQVDGSQSELTILIWKDKKERDWWMKVNEKVIGYWPAMLFTDLKESASILEWGGEVINKNKIGQHTSTQMGSGNFPQEGFKKASYIRNIQTIAESNTLQPPQDLTTSAVPQKSCYDIGNVLNDDPKWGTYFFYGGPGRNPNCQ